MFETKKTLIVVYKDELLMNQLKKMVETCDDSEKELQVLGITPLTSFIGRKKYGLGIRRQEISKAKFSS